MQRAGKTRTSRKCDCPGGSVAGGLRNGRCGKCADKDKVAVLARNPMNKSEDATVEHSDWLASNGLPELIEKHPGHPNQSVHAGGGARGKVKGAANAVRRHGGRSAGGSIAQQTALFGTVKGSKTARRIEAKTGGRKATYRNAERTKGLRQAEEKHGFTTHSKGHVISGAAVWNSKKDRSKARRKLALKAGAGFAAGVALGAMSKSAEHADWVDANSLPPLD